MVRVRSVDDGNEASRSRQRYRRAGWGYAATIAARSVSFVAAIATIPLTLPYLGSERFGMWMTINSFVTLLGFANLGIGQSLMNEIARHQGHGDGPGQRASISNALAISSVLGLVLAATAVILGPSVPWWRVFNVSSPNAVSEAGPAMAVFGVMFLANIPIGIAGSVWNGLQRTYVTSLFLALGPLIGIAGVFACVLTHQGLPALVAAAAGGPLLAATMCAGVLIFGRPDLRPSIHLISITGVRSLLGIGLGFFLLQVAIAIATGSDALVLAQVVGPAAVAEYAIVARLFNIPSQLGATVVTTLWPGLSEARSRGDFEWVAVALRRVLIATSAITVPLVAALVIVGPSIVNVVAQGRVSPNGYLYLAFAAATIAVVFTSTASVFLNSADVVWPQVICLASMAAANIALGVWLSARVGTSGVVLSTAFTYGMTLMPLTLLIRRRISGNPPRSTA